MSEPRHLSDGDSRQRARHIRDGHWEFMERLQLQGTVHVCSWNKYRLEPREDELMLCLVSGMELAEWLRAHPDWFEIGPQSRERWTNPVSLTPAGLAALSERDRYDSEPVFGGMVEPGWQAIPAPREEAR